MPVYLDNAATTRVCPEAARAALEAMTEAEYDPAVIDAYLDALDRKAPMPDHPDAGTAYAGFQARVQRAAGQVSGRRASRRSRVRRSSTELENLTPTAARR